MLFNSLEFIFLFLPLVLAGYAAVGRLFQGLAGAAWLTAASFAFYACWQIKFLPLMALLIIFNYCIGNTLARRAPGRARTMMLATGVIVDLAALGYFKYVNFFIANANVLLGGAWPALDVVLPLGISFFTFTQIAYLVDTHRGTAHGYNPIHYCLFVTYFPHLAAGPILHHAEIMPQFQDRAIYSLKFENAAPGLTIFAIGLFKKVVLADSIAPYASLAFSAAAAGQPLGLVDAWCGALAYTLQLYFDFSGYSDMAIGLSRLFGIHLPINFDSPYKAASIIEFWRRWHMSLSRFLRDYLYISLGGSRQGPVRRHFNLFVTMLLGGLWHGAAWTFVVWGAFHGALLIVNHWWRTRSGTSPPTGRGMRLAAWLLTFVMVVIGWVFFRSANLEAALVMLRGMSGWHGMSLPGYWLDALGQAGQFLQSLGVRGADLSQSFGGRNQIMWIVCLMAIAFIAPNTQEIMSRHGCGIEIYKRYKSAPGWWAWTPNLPWTVATAAILLYSLSRITQVSEFLYWQF